MYKLFSVDDHIVEPPNVWADRMPAKYREAAPHVVEEHGRQSWVYEDQRVLTMGLNAVVGKPQSEWGNEPLRYDDMIPGCYDPNQRAIDMRANGIVASVNFPTLPRFGGARFLDFADKQLADLCVKAWNDFVLDEWCPAAPEMFVPMVICQLWDPELAAAEVRRCAELGARALCFVENPAPLGLPSVHTDVWDPLWTACQETGLPICMHIASSGGSVVGETDEPGIVQIAAAFTKAAHSTVNLLLSPVLTKFPDLKMVWSEGGIGWVPAALERADRQFLRHQGWTHLDGPLPSELCHRNMWFCMIEEPIGLTFREHVGVDRILWECDYPHADSTWPDSQQIAKDLFGDLSDDEVERISHGNAAALFNWPV
ncbi:MAG: amidohydrolase family protein [Acidimicrobiia bacterium]